MTPNSREQDLSRYSRLSGSIHWGSLDIIKRVRPETQAHDFRDMLLLKSMYFRFFSLYNIGIPLFSREQELSWYTDPTQLKECYHNNNHKRVWSETQAFGVVRSGVKNRFGPHCTPPPLFWTPNSREQELSRYSHLSDSIPWGSLDIILRVRPETQARDLRDMLLLKSMYFRFFSLYNIGIPFFSREQELSRYTDPTQLHECYHTNNHNRVRSETQASRVVTSGSKTGLDLIAPPLWAPTIFSRTRVILV